MALTPKQFQKLTSDLNSAFEKAHGRLFSLAEKVAECSDDRKQCEELKEIFRRAGYTVDQYRRIILYGLGVMAKHLAIPSQGLRAATFERLPEKDKKRVNNPNAIVKVSLPSGISLSKKVSDLTPQDWNLVAPSKRGSRCHIISIAEQKEEMARRGLTIYRGKHADWKKDEDDTVRIQTTRANVVIDVPASILQAALKRKKPKKVAQQKSG